MGCFVTRTQGLQDSTFLLMTDLMRLSLFLAALLAPLGMYGNESSVQAPRLVSSPESGWPQFRGPSRDGVSRESRLLQEWPEGGPKSLWSAAHIGSGYSSPIVVNGRVIITGDMGESLRITAFDLSGKLLWATTNGMSWKDPYPGARSTVTAYGGALFHMNAHGRLVCLGAERGNEKWSVNVLDRFGGENITWGLSECLAVDERAVYVTAGGKQALIAALSLENGKTIWTTPGQQDPSRDGKWESASYVSPILVEQQGRRWLLGCSLRQLYCVDARTGELQWMEKRPTTYSVLAMTPALFEGGVFMTAPHGKGGHFFGLTMEKGKSRNVELWSSKLDTCQGGVVVMGDKLIGSHYSSRKGWVALNAKTGGVLYELPDRAKGSALAADGRIYAFCEDGWMLLLEPGSDAFRTKGKFRFAEASRMDAWAHPVVANGKLYLRYHDRLDCFDISAK